MQFLVYEVWFLKYRIRAKNVHEARSTEARNETEAVLPAKS